MKMDNFKNGKIGLGVIILAVTLASCGSDVPRPRGVSLARAPLYSPSKDFTCLDGSLTIPFVQVNDDYCDCFDGSDEPGTSACMNGIFHCINAGHKSINIPSSRVNDGVCDCCDGSDEYSDDRVTCENTCDVLGREARAEAQRRAELHKQGAQVRLELIQKGNEKRSSMGEQLNQLEKDKAEAEQIVAEKEALRNEAEALENAALEKYRQAEEAERLEREAEEAKRNEEEATEIFVKFDSDADGALTLNELQTRSVFDKNRDGAVSDEEARYFLAENEAVDLEKFKTECWSLVKPFLMVEQGMFVPPSGEGEPAIPVEQSETPVDGDMPENPETEEEDDLQEDEEHEEPEQGEEEKEGEHPDEEQEIRTDYDEETKRLVEVASQARKQHSEAERTVREILSSINNIKQDLEKNYGPQQVFATLDGECVEYTDKEYVYKLCLFDKATQNPKNGGGEIKLGSWGEWSGPSTDKYSSMIYSGGLSCWNGPNRSAHVNIECGLETKLVSVTEPSRCEYHFELLTPAACHDVQPAVHDHDEL